jgi:cyclohexa-1,5-dienecarbonyl-CoA hydratase
LTITISAGKGNVLSVAVMNDIRKALAAHKDERALRMALITGAGPHFSYGASVEEHTRDRVDAMLPAFHAMIRDVALFPVPVAALVRGRCMGGAFELALACHFVLAAEGALFSCPEIKLGVFPPVLAALGPHRLGGALAERLLLTGDDLRADDAMRAGFVAAVFPEAADPIESALVWYRARLGALSGSSIRLATKAARVAGGLVDRLGASLDFAERLYLDELANTHDGNEGISAFIAQRRPAWSHA